MVRGLSLCNLPVTQMPARVSVCVPPGRAEDVRGAGGGLYEQRGRGQHSCSN